MDSPDFTLRVAKEVKKINHNIKTIHYVAPQVWIWRKKRVKKLKNFLDHLLLLFPFEKKYFEKENIICTFVGHPLLESKFKLIDLNYLNINEKKIVSIFPGSRLSEINVLMPILINFIELSKDRKKDFIFVFHSTKYYENTIKQFLSKSQNKNYIVVSDENIKKNILKKSIFAIAKSGTISLEICNEGVPSIIIYKMNFINFFIIRLMIKVKFANIINIINESEIIPELLQSKCNPYKIDEMFNLFTNNIKLCKDQVSSYQKTLDEIKTKSSSSENVSAILKDNL